jgi:hypothetical protein
MRTALKFMTGPLIVGMLACVAGAAWFDHQKHALSGVPAGHFAKNEGGRLFYVPRGGPPIDQRPQVSLTAEQYRLWEENDQASSLWAGRAALCFLAFAGIVVWLKLVGPRRQGAEQVAAADGGRDAGFS